MSYQKWVVMTAVGLSVCGFGAEPTLKSVYERHCREISDINEHLPVLRDLAVECSSVVEIGVRGMVSTWGFLQGLADHSSPNRKYIGIDLYYPAQEMLHLADSLATKEGILFSFWKGNDMQVDLPEVDLLFIDSLHTYCHLIYELEKFSPQVRKYIALHDTSPPWELKDEPNFHGDFAEYPAHINRFKQGLWPAVEDFLATHSDWELHERRTNCHGLTILKRVEKGREDEPQMAQNLGLKVLYTSALIPHKYEERKQEYIQSLQILENAGYLPNTYVIESGPPTIFSFFEEHAKHVFYSATNDLSLRNKGVNELKSLIHFCKVHDIQDDEMIVKLTGRYYFENDFFLKHITAHPELDAAVSFREKAIDNCCLQTGCFAIKGKHFKNWLKKVDLQKLEEEMIDVEWDFTRFIRSLILQEANVEIMDKVGVAAHIAD